MFSICQMFVCVEKLSLPSRWSYQYDPLITVVLVVD